MERIRENGLCGVGPEGLALTCENWEAWQCGDGGRWSGTTLLRAEGCPVPGGKECVWLRGFHACALELPGNFVGGTAGRSRGAHTVMRLGQGWTLPLGCTVLLAGPLAQTPQLLPSTPSLQPCGVGMVLCSLLRRPWLVVAAHADGA